MLYLPLFTLCLSLANDYEVVALGTGNFNTKESISSNGRIVHDSHAVVTARRSLMRFVATMTHIFLCVMSRYSKWFSPLYTMMEK